MKVTNDHHKKLINIITTKKHFKINISTVKKHLQATPFKFLCTVYTTKPDSKFSVSLTFLKFFFNSENVITLLYFFYCHILYYYFEETHLFQKLPVCLPYLVLIFVFFFGPVYYPFFFS